MRHQTVLQAALRGWHRWRNAPVEAVIRISLVFTLSLTPVAGATKASVRVPKGQVQTSIDLEIERLLDAGARIRVHLPDATWEASLSTPDGERIGEPVILSQTFAVEAPDAAPRAKPKRGRILDFRAIRELPPGRYRVHLEGNALNRATARAEYIPRTSQKSSNSGAYCDFLCVGKEDIPMLVAAAPIWVPFVLWWRIDSALEDAKTARGIDRQIPGHATVHATPLRMPGASLSVGVHAPIAINGWVINGKIRLFDRLELRAEYTPFSQSDSDGNLIATGSEKVLTKIPIARTGNAGFIGYYRLPAPGDYLFHVRAEGETVSGQRFAVEGTSQPPLRIEAPAVEFLSMEEALIDANANGRPEAWRIRTRVRVYTAGEYAATLPLGGFDKPAACRLRQDVSLAAGDREIDFLVNPAAIRECFSSGVRAKLQAIDLSPIERPLTRVVWQVPRFDAVSGGAPGLRQFHSIDWEDVPSPPAGAERISPGKRLRRWQ